MKMREMLFCLWIIALLFGCANQDSQPRNVPEKEMRSLQKIYIDEVQPQHAVRTEETLQLTISGNLPSPAYEFERFDVKVSGDTIEITPLANYDSDKMVAQVLVPFEKVCDVTDLAPGAYKIKVHGRGDTVVSATSVEVKK